MGGAGRPNLWGTVPTVVEMQSEGGAAGALHGALQAGALATTFTASQGLLLMIPNMYKIAGELTPTVIPRRGARAGHAGAVDLRRPQRRHGGAGDRLRDARLGLGAGGRRLGRDRPRRDAGVARAVPALLRRLPHLPRGGEGRAIGDDILRAMIDERIGARAPRPGAVAGPPGDPRHRPEPRRVLPGPRGGEPVLPCRARRSCSAAMDRFATLTGRSYRLFDYVGAPDAERVIVLMGSGAETAEETVEHAERAGRAGRRAEGAALPAVLRPPRCSPPCLRRRAPSPCWTGPRSRAARASRSTSMSWPP